MTLDITRLKVSHDPTNQLNLTPSMFIRDQALDITAGIQGIVDLLRDAIVEAITGLVGGLLPDLAQFFVNLDDFLGVDFNLPEFDLFGAIADFVDTRLLPSGLFDFLDQSELVQKVLDVLAGVFEVILPGSGTIGDAEAALARLRQAGVDAQARADEAWAKAQQAINDLLQLLNQLWYRPWEVISNLIASMIPGLDASKIISGKFAQSMLNITSIAASIITGVLNALQIPGLDASKIISGKFAQSMLNITSIAASIITGVLNALQIPGLDASKIISGKFAQAMVDGLVDALNGLGNDITQLLYDLWNNPWEVISNLIASMIPGLDASKIISGKFAQAMLNITSIAASIITGVLNALQIPGLDASKITTGKFAQSMVDGLVTSLNNLVNLIDGIAEALFPTGGVGRPVAEAIDSIQGILGVGRQAQTSADKANIGVEAIRSELAGGSYDEFDYPIAATLPFAQYAATYSGSSSSTFGPSGKGTLVWKPSGVGDRGIEYRRSDMSLAGDVATLNLVFSKPPHEDLVVKSYAYLAWRMSASDKSCVRVKIGANRIFVQSLNAAGTITEHTGGGWIPPAPVEAGDTIEARFSANLVAVYHNRTLVGQAAATGIVDANHRQFGFGVYVPTYTWFSGHPCPELAGVTWAPTFNPSLQALATGRQQ